MSRRDWDFDEPLNFDYSAPEPSNSQRPLGRTARNAAGEDEAYRLLLEQRKRREVEQQEKLKRQAKQRALERFLQQQRATREVNITPEAPTSPQPVSYETPSYGEYAKPVSDLARFEYSPGSDEPMLETEDAAEELSAKLSRKEKKQLKKQQKEQQKEEKRDSKEKKPKKEKKQGGRKAKGRESSLAALASQKKNTKFNKFTRIWAIIYLVSVIAFAVIMVIMDVLPLKKLILLFAVLALLSVILFMQLYYPNVKKWAKIFATVLSIFLFLLYSIGSAYALGTLSFLDDISVDNENRVNVTKEPFVMVCSGKDTWSKLHDEEGRSDVNMVVAVNPQSEQILMVSIPRDYYVEMPHLDYATDKLTHAGMAGPEATVGTLEHLLGFTANYYALANFSTVEKFVDAIGGIDLENDQEFTSALHDDLVYKEGEIHLNGREALYFARERKAFQLGDNTRIQNQQKVMEAIITKAIDSKTMLLKYNKILGSMKDYVEMNMSSKEIRSLVKLQLAKSPDWKISKYCVTGHDGNVGGAYVMTQDYDSVAYATDLIRKLMNGDDVYLELNPPEEEEEESN